MSKFLFALLWLMFASVAAIGAGYGDFDGDAPDAWMHLTLIAGMLIAGAFFIADRP